MSIDRFIAQVKGFGLSRTNRYTVRFTPPVSVFQDMSSLLLLCDQVNLPGLSYSTTQNRIYGEFREVPYEKLYENLTFSFYVDKRMEVKAIFDRWMEYIQHPLRRTFNYYDSYIVPLTITVQDLNEKTQYTVDVFECYPKQISTIQLDSASKDVMKLQVSMQYKFYQAKNQTDIQNNANILDTVVPNSPINSMAIPKVF